MASYDITDEYQTLLDHGLTDEQIERESGCPRLYVRRNLRTGEYWGAETQNRASQDRWERYYPARIAELTAPKASEQDAGKATTGPLATAKQVQFIMKLIGQGRHREGGYYSGPTTREEVERMGRRDASAYIDSLLGNY